MSVATAEQAAKAFAAAYGAKWPKAVAKITDDLDQVDPVLTGEVVESEQHVREQRPRRTTRRVNKR